MSRPAVSSPDTSETGLPCREDHNQTVNNLTDKAARAGDLEILVSESKHLSQRKRQRNRKLSNPQRRLKHVSTRQDLESMYDVSVTTHSPEQHLKWPPNVCTNEVRFKSSQDEHKPQDPTPDEGKQEEFVEGYNNDVVDGIKSETVHGFIVDQWYDLGPCLHNDGHSPVPLSSSEVEKCESMEYSEELPDKVTSQTESPTDCDSKRSTRTSNITTQTLDADSTIHKAHNLQMVHFDKMDTSTDKDTISTLSEDKHGKESTAVIDLVASSLTQPFPVHSSFFRCPPQNVSTPFGFQPDAFHLPLHAASPYFHTTDSVNSFSHVNTSSSSFTVSPSGICSYATNLDMTKSTIAYPYTRLETDLLGPKQNEVACLHEPTNQLLEPASGVTATSIASGPINIASATSESAHIPSVAGNFFSISCSRLGESVSIPGLLYPNSLYPIGPFHPSGVILVPSRPFYVQHVPYVPVLPAVSYSQSQTAISDSTPYAESRVPTPCEAISKVDSNAKTSQCTQAQNIVKIPSPKITAQLVTDVKPGPGDDHSPSVGSSSQQHHSRTKVKSKMATSSDFLDPTRIKFGADDVDTDDDGTKLKDGSDCSDEEWQPYKRHEKITGWRDSGSDDGWTPSGVNEFDSPVKRTYIRRRKRSSKEPAECEECGKVFQGIYYLRRHQMSHSDIRPYQCETCQKSFKQKAHLIGHLTVHDRALKQRAADIKNTSPKSKTLIVGNKCPGRPKKTYTHTELTCKECGKAFKTVYRLKRHELSHTDVRPFSCRICGKGFKQTGHRNEHEANHEITKKRFLCNLCGVVFRSRSSFNNHMRSHGTEKLRLQASKINIDGCCVDTKAETGEVCPTGYDCPYCTDKFATAQALNNHLETHVEVHQRRHVQPYTCDVCRRAFTYRHNLIKHKLVHKSPDKFAHFYQEKMDAHVASGKPSFKCEMCDKVFIRKETMAKHFKIHSGTKPFKCMICSNEFTQNVHLKVHMRKHTGSRPFQCKECHRSFIDSTALAKHIEYEACNTDNCLYHCRICEKLHYYMGSLKQHIRKKHGVKEEEVETYILKSERSNKRKVTSEVEKHPCKVCLSIFSEKCNLVRHIRRKHADLVELLQKELQVKTENNLPYETAQNDNVEKWSNEYKDSEIEKDREIDKDSEIAKDSESDNDREIDKDSESDKDREIDKDSQGTLEGSLNWSSVEPCVRDVADMVEANRDGTTRQMTTDEDVCEGRVCSTRDQVGYSPPTATVCIKTTDITKGSQREDWTLETSAPQVINSLDVSSSSFAEHKDRKLQLKRGEEEEDEEEEEESADVFLEGFRMNGSPLSARHLGHHSVQEYFFCKDHCCSDIQGSHRLTAESDYFLQRDLSASVSKDSGEENCSSPTDINFLYNIGLIVAKKAKMSTDSSVEMMSGSLGSISTSDAYLPPDESCISFDKDGKFSRNGTDGLTLGTQDKNLQHNHVCYRPDELVFREESFSATSITLPSQNGSGESNLNIESKQDLETNFSDKAGKEITTLCSVPAARGDHHDKPGRKDDFKLREDPYLSEESSLQNAENSSQGILQNVKNSSQGILQNVKNSSQGILHSCVVTGMDSTSGGGDADLGSCMKSLLQCVHVGQMDVSASSAPLCQQVVTTGVDSRLILETAPMDDISVFPFTQEDITLKEEGKHRQCTEDNFGHTRIKDQSIYSTERTAEPVSEPLGTGRTAEPVSEHLGTERTAEPLGTERTAEPVPEPLATECTAEPVSEPLGTERTAEPVSEPLGTGRTAEPVSEHLGTERTAEPVSEHLGTERTAEPVSEHLGTERTAEPVSEHLGTERTAEPVPEHLGTERTAEPLGTERTAEPVSEHLGTERTAEPLGTERTAEPVPEPLATERTAEPVSEPLATERTAEPMPEPLRTERTAEPVPEPLASLAREHEREYFQSRPNVDDSITLVTPASARLGQEQLGQSLVTSSGRQSSWTIRKDPQEEPTNELLSHNPGDSTCLPWANEVPSVTSSSREVNPRSDISWQPLNKKSKLAELESATQKDAHAAIRERLIGSLSDQTKLAAASVTRLESTRDNIQTTSKHPYHLESATQKDDPAAVREQSVDIPEQLIGSLSDQTKPAASSAIRLELTRDEPKTTSKHPDPQPDCSMKPADRCAQPKNNAASRLSTADSSSNDYEACPSESHLNYLGLLACKDAQAIKNKTIPLEDLYETYKPWLEDLVNKTRPRRSRLNKARTSCREYKDKGNRIDVTCIQIPASSNYTDIAEKQRESIFKENPEPKTFTENGNTRKSPTRPSILKRRIRLVKKGIIPDQETEEQLSQEMTTVELSYLRGSQEIGKYRGSCSPPERELLNTATSTLASSTTHPQTPTVKSVATTTADSTTSTNPEPMTRATSCGSPPSTPDSTVKGRQIYSCSVCSKYFTARHQLKRHELSHTNHRPYNCEQCGRAFRQKVHLSDHVKRHQGQRPFLCTGCGKRFVLKNEMNQHMKNHCRATVDVLKGSPLLCDKNILSIPTNELSCLPSSSGPGAQPQLDNMDFTEMSGQTNGVIP